MSGIPTTSDPEYHDGANIPRRNCQQSLNSGGRYPLSPDSPRSLVLSVHGSSYRERPGSYIFKQTCRTTSSLKRFQHVVSGFTLSPPVFCLVSKHEDMLFLISGTSYSHGSVFFSTNQFTRRRKHFRTTWDLQIPLHGNINSIHRLRLDPKSLAFSYNNHVNCDRGCGLVVWIEKTMLTCRFCRASYKLFYLLVSTLRLS